MALEWNPDDVMSGAAKAARSGVVTTGPKRDRATSAEAGLAAKAALTPEESAADQSFNMSDANLAMLEREIAGQKDPKARAALEEVRADIVAGRAKGGGTQPKAAETPKAAMKWEEVTAKPEWAKLTVEQKEATRNQYFIDVVAPQVPTEQLDEVRAAFDADTKQTLGKTIKTAVAPALDAAAGIAKGAFQWAKEGVLGAGSVMDAPLPNRSEQAGSVAPLSQSGMDSAAAIAKSIGTAGVDAVRGNPAAMARAVVAASEDPQRKADDEAVAAAIKSGQPVKPAAAPKRELRDRYNEYAKNYPMLGPDDIWASIRRDTADGVDRSSPVAKAAKGQTQMDMQDWLTRQKNQASADAGRYVAPALARGASHLVGGMTEFVTGLLPSTFNHFIANPILTAAGSSYQFPMVSGIGSEPFDKATYQNPPSKIGQKKWDDLKGLSETADWLGERLAEQAPQMAGMLTAAFAPRAAANLYLLGMGASSAGSQYRENVVKHPNQVGNGILEAWVEGQIETLSEMLPLGVFQKIQEKIGGLSMADKAGFLGRMLRAGGVGVAAAGAQAATGGIEEVVAQVGQNMAKRWMLGENVAWDDGVKEAAIVGAVAGAAMSMPHTAAAAIQAFAPQEGDGVLSRAAKAGMVGLAAQQAQRGIPGAAGDILTGDAAAANAAVQGEMGGAAPGNPAETVVPQGSQALALPPPAPIQMAAGGVRTADTSAEEAQAQQLYAERAGEEFRRDMAMKATTGPKLLPAPDSKTGRDVMVNDGDFTREETYEDQRARLESLAKLEARQQAELERTNLGMTADVERAQQRRAMREDGIDPNQPETIGASGSQSADHSPDAGKMVGSQTADAAPTSRFAPAANAEPKPDIVRADGTPFKTETAANRARKARKVPKSWKLVAVDGGFAWRAPQRRQPKAAPEDNAANYLTGARKRLVAIIKAAGGINTAEAGDFTGASNGFRANQMLPGVFRKSGGLRADMLASLLHENGYLSDADLEADGDNLARQMIADAIAGEFVGKPEELLEYGQRLRDEYNEQEIAQSGYDALADAEQEQVADYDDSMAEAEAVIDEIAGAEISVEEAMRLLGFTEEEIASDAKARAGAVEKPGDSGAKSAPQGDGSGGAPGSSQARQGTAPEESGGEGGGQGDRQGQGQDQALAAPEPKTKTPAKAGVSVSAKPLDQITVQVKAIEAETGKTVTMRERADRVLADLDQQIQTAKALLECL